MNWLANTWYEILHLTGFPVDRYLGDVREFGGLSQSDRQQLSTVINQTLQQQQQQQMISIPLSSIQKIVDELVSIRLKRDFDVLRRVAAVNPQMREEVTQHKALIAQLKKDLETLRATQGQQTKIADLELKLRETEKSLAKFTDYQKTIELVQHKPTSDLPLPSTEPLQLVEPLAPLPPPPPPPAPTNVAPPPLPQQTGEKGKPSAFINRVQQITVKELVKQIAELDANRIRQIIEDQDVAESFQRSSQPQKEDKNVGKKEVVMPAKLQSLMISARSLLFDDFFPKELKDAPKDEDQAEGVEKRLMNYINKRLNVQGELLKQVKLYDPLNAATQNNTSPWAVFWTSCEAAAQDKEFIQQYERIFQTIYVGNPREWRLTYLIGKNAWKDACVQLLIYQLMIPRFDEFQRVMSLYKAHIDCRSVLGELALRIDRNERFFSRFTNSAAGTQHCTNVARLFNVIYEIIVSISGAKIENVKLSADRINTLWESTQLNGDKLKRSDIIVFNYMMSFFKPLNQDATFILDSRNKEQVNVRVREMSLGKCMLDIDINYSSFVDLDTQYELFLGAFNLLITHLSNTFAEDKAFVKLLLPIANRFVQQMSSPENYAAINDVANAALTEWANNWKLPNLRLVYDIVEFAQMHVYNRPLELRTTTYKFFRSLFEIDEGEMYKNKLDKDYITLLARITKDVDYRTANKNVRDLIVRAMTQTHSLESKVYKKVFAIVDESHKIFLSSVPNNGSINVHNSLLRLFLTSRESRDFASSSYSKKENVASPEEIQAILREFDDTSSELRYPLSKLTAVSYIKWPNETLPATGVSDVIAFLKKISEYVKEMYELIGTPQRQQKTLQTTNASFGTLMHLNAYRHHVFEQRYLNAYSHIFIT